MSIFDPGDEAAGPLLTNFDIFVGIGKSDREVMLDSSMGDLLSTKACLACSTSSSSSTLTFVISFVSLKLLGRVEYIVKGSDTSGSQSLCLKEVKRERNRDI